MRFNAPFTMYKRDTKEGRIWCVSYYDDQGQRVRKSTRETTKAKAMKAALRMVTRQDRDAPTLREYTRRFHVWGECSWIKRQHANGKGFKSAVGAKPAGHVGQPHPSPVRLDADGRTQPTDD